MKPLAELLGTYVRDGTIDVAAMKAIARAIGGKYTFRDGAHVVTNAGGRVVAAGMRARNARRSPLSTIPCATCGALPIGEYSNGADVDDRRRYGCGPHRAFKVDDETGERIYLDGKP